MLMTWRRRIGLATVAVVIVAGLWLAFRPPPVPADMVTIGSGDVVVTVDAEGVTRISEIYEVSAPISGRLMRSALEVGDVVQEGQTVAAIRPTPPEFLNVRDRSAAQARLRAATAAKDLAEAEVRRARAELDFARSDLARAERLSETQTVSARDLDRARLEAATKDAAVLSAEANLAVRREEVESARAVLIEPDSPDAHPGTGDCCVNVVAPEDGRVLAILHKSETVVAAGTPLVRLGDATQLEIVVDLLSSDAVRVSIGDVAAIDRWGGGEPLAATVTRIEPTGFTKVSALGIEEQRVRVVLDFTAPRGAWSALGHDYRVFARIRTDIASDVVSVPVSALFRVGSDWAVFAVQDGQARLRSVTIGLRNTEVAEVDSGLMPGDSVIVHPSDRIADGVAVVSRRELQEEGT